MPFPSQVVCLLNSVERVSTGEDRALTGLERPGKEVWRRRPDLNRGWRFCRPLPYHLATAPIGNLIVQGFSGRVYWTLQQQGIAVGPVIVMEAAIRDERNARPYDPAHPGGRSGSARRPRHVPAGVQEVPAGKKNGAGNGIRTRDFDLGKVALYH
jgi:hypothetical protein